MGYYKGYNCYCGYQGVSGGFVGIYQVAGLEADGLAHNHYTSTIYPYTTGWSGADPASAKAQADACAAMRAWIDSQSPTPPKPPVPGTYHCFLCNLDFDDAADLATHNQQFHGEIPPGPIPPEPPWPPTPPTPSNGGGGISSWDYTFSTDAWAPSSWDYASTWFAKTEAGAWGAYSNAWTSFTATSWDSGGTWGTSEAGAGFLSGLWEWFKDIFT